MIATETTTKTIDPTVSCMSISPTMASNWLEHANTNNRHLREAYAKQLARDMIQGEWRLTHEGIAFDPHGMLLDGQHRLRAIVLADIAIEMHVFFNITPEALEVINGGKSRSLADRLRLGRQHGDVTCHHTSTLKAMLGGLSGPLTMTGSEASAALGHHREAVEFALNAVPRGKHIANGTVRGVIARAYYSADHDRLRAFGQMLSTGVVPDANMTAVILLRQYLCNSGGTSNHQVRERYAKTERALMAFLQAEPITRLMPAKQELFALPEGVKV